MLYFNLIGKFPNDITTEIEADSYTEVKVSKKDEKDTTYDVSCSTNKIGKTKGSNVNITCESSGAFKENDEIVLYTDDKGYSGYVKIIYEGNIDIVLGDDADTTDMKDVEGNGGNNNGKKDEDNSSYYYHHIIVYLILLILL